MRRVGEAGDLRRRVARAQLGALGDRHHARLDGVLVAEPGELGGDELGRQLAVGRGDREQLDRAHLLGRSTLIDVDVRARRADRGRGPGPAREAQADDVGSRAVEHEIGLAAGAEVALEDLTRPRGPRIRPVGRRVAIVGLLDGGQDVRVGPRVVV